MSAIVVARTRLFAFLAVILLAVAALAGCAGEDDEPSAISMVEVGGEFGSLPQVSFPTPLPVTETEAETVIEGHGTKLAKNDIALVSFVAVDATSGKVIEDNFDTQPQTMRVSKHDAGPLYNELLGAQEGSRILRVELGTSKRPDPVVLVYDVMHTRAWGKPVAAPKDAPKVRLKDSGEPEITIPDHKAPSGLQIVPLKQGDGAQIAPGMSVTVRYKAVSWQSGKVVDSTWEKGEAPVTIAFTGLIEGWQNGLVDVRTGSQIMLVVPPEQAFGEDTLVYVIDVLALAPLTGTEGE